VTSGPSRLGVNEKRRHLEEVASDERRASETVEQAAFGPFRPCEKTGRGKPRPYDKGTV
jgi:hypothetical protein